jgi:hypothetical protein
MQPNTADKRKVVTRGLHRRVTVPESLVVRRHAVASDLSAWHRHLRTDDLPGLEVPSSVLTSKGDGHNEMHSSADANTNLNAR